MRILKVRSIVAGLALVLSAGLASAANSPAYDSWASAKPGSSVTMKATTEAAGQKNDTIITYVLDEVTPDNVTLDVKTSMVVAGNKMDLPARKMNVPRGATTAVAPAPTKPIQSANAKQTTEKVTIGDKTYTCQVTEANSDANGMKIASKTWISNDVPNLLVKSEASTTGAVASKTLMEVTKIELK